MQLKESFFRSQKIFLLYGYKFIKNPLNIIFVFAFTIGSFVANFFIYGSGEATDIRMINPTLMLVPDANTSDFTFLVAGLLLFSATVITLTSLPILFGSDRIYKRTKFLKILGVTKYNYLFGIGAFNLSVFLIFIIVQILVSKFAFGVNISPQGYIGLFIIDIIVFTLMMFLSLFISQWGNSERQISSISILIFFLVLYTSSVAIPSFVIDNGEGWFKYIQFFSPTGAATYWGNAIVLNEFTTNFNLDWTTDFLGILIPLVEFIIFIYFSLKFFKWK